MSQVPDHELPRKLGDIFRKVRAGDPLTNEDKELLRSLGFGKADASGNPSLESLKELAKVLDISIPGLDS